MFKKFRSLLALLLASSLLLICLPVDALATELEELQPTVVDTDSEETADPAEEEGASDGEGEDASADPDVAEPEEVGETTWTEVSDPTEIAQLIRENWSDNYFQEAIVDTHQNLVTLDGETAALSDAFDNVTEENEDEIFSSADAAEEYFADTPYETETQSDGTISVTAPYQTCRVILYADSLDEDYGAETILVYSAYSEYVLQFATAEDTCSAYEQIVACYGAENCYVDQLITAADLFLSDGEEETTTTYSWGTSYMGMDTLKANASAANDTVTVAIVDSGIDADHEFFEGRTISADSCNFLAETDAETTDLSDPYGHGTHVAGIIAEATPDNVELMILRILDANGNATLALVNTAIQYALERGADVINLSLGVDNSGGITYTYLDEVIQAAYDAGIPVCCAAGNNKTDVYYPASNALTIAVSAINSSGVFVGFSNYGESIDFCAPGMTIVSAKVGGGTVSKSGTSMAAAELTAALTYAITAYPDATVDELYSVLQSCATDLGDEGKDVYYGWGSVTGLADLFSSLSDCTLTLSSTRYTCDGTAKEPAVTITDAEGNTLTEGTDYIIEYSDNTKIGTATVTATGKGRYTGVVTATFTISALGTPTLSSVSNTSSGVKIAWQAVTGAVQYRVCRKASGDSKWTRIGVTTSTCFIDTTATSGVTYKYTVRCLSADGSIYTSNYDSTGLSIVSLTAGQISSLTNTSKGITVKWSKVTGASGYYVYRKTSGGSYQKIATVKSGSTVSYSDTAVKSKSGTTYTYAVRAYSGSTLGGYVGKTTVRLTGVSISSLKNSSSKKITVKWGKNTKATGYLIQYSTSSSFSSYKTVTVSSYKTVCKTISSLTKGKKYYVRVRAYKTVSGTKYYSAWSSTKNVKISR
ncbi:MAG: S8 family serine peptidase [Clostridiales bacterium]|nr:S8 family serine peptidase [Clostridiales bacterium]